MGNARTRQPPSAVRRLPLPAPSNSLHPGAHLTRPSLAHYSFDRDEVLERATDVLGWVASGELKLTYDRTLPLDEAPEAHRLLEARKTTGKLLLVSEAP